jgi:periplasmic copper chaperone A
LRSAGRASRVLLVLLAAALQGCPSTDHQPGALTITRPWTRATGAGMPMGVAYLTITNHGGSPDALVAASSPAAARVEIHQTSIVGGIAHMRPLTEVPIAAGATVNIEPGGIHLMLVDLKSPLSEAVPLTLDFRVAGRITVNLDIESGEP